MGLSLCFLFCEYFFFFQKENETQKLLCVFEGYSLQHEKIGIWIEPLKLSEQKKMLRVWALNFSGCGHFSD